MSASDKKKLRAAERAEKLTQNQLAAQKEAKKLKIMTTVFVVALALMVCFAIVITAVKTVENSGIRERNSVALTLNDQQISSAELNYYFIDSVNTFANQYGSYAYLLGLDTSLPLNEQVIDEETGETWADDFLTGAVENIKAVYALNNAAEEAGFTLTDEQKTDIEASIATVELYATVSYGYPDLESYLTTLYGHGASVESYTDYRTMNYIAEAYQESYFENLTYEDADLREAESENYHAYSSFSYNYYYLNATNLIEGEDKTNYTDEQYADAVALAEKYAKELTAEATSVDAFDAAIAALPENASAESVASTAAEDVLYSSVLSTLRDWVTDVAREAGDVEYIPSITTTTDTSGNETSKTNGYYVVMFNGCNENNYSLANVRHILVAFEGGTTDDSGVTTYSEEEMNAAKEEAEALLSRWSAGDASEASFAELANKESDDGDGTTGGLYANVYPGQMVTNFNDWCFDANRKAGDTDVIETEYGYHVMFYVGDSTLSYRDYMITSDLKNNDLDIWFTGLTEAVNATLGDTQYLSMDLTFTTN